MKVAALLLVCLAATAMGQTGPGDADILNFALQLEYLEGEFYSCAAFGTPLADSLRGGGPPSTGCQKAQLTGAGQAYAEEIANNEIDHVTFLRAALGSAAEPIPAINIGSAFAAAADAAAGTTLAPPFTPYANNLFFYHGAFIFEDVGVTAYRGAAPLISNSTYLSAAAGILGTEAYHGGVIRTLLYQSRDTELPYNVTVEAFIELIADLRDSVDGSDTLDAGIVTDDGGSILVPVDANSLVHMRTPAQVLAIVYLGSASQPGGFFPQGINGYFGPMGAGAPQS